MSALEQAAAYANDAECPILAKRHILALLEMVRRRELDVGLLKITNSQPFDEAKEREMFEVEYPLSPFLTWLPDFKRYELADSSTAPEAAWDGCVMRNEKWRTWLARARIATKE